MADAKAPFGLSRVTSSTDAVDEGFDLRRGAADGEPAPGVVRRVDRNFEITPRQQRRNPISPFDKRETRRVEVLIRAEVEELVIILESIRVEVINRHPPA